LLVRRGRVRAFDAVGVLVTFQQGVALEFLLDVGRELDIRELQQFDRLLQLRRHDERLRLSQLEARSQSHDAHRSRAPPRTRVPVAPPTRTGPVLKG